MRQRAGNTGRRAAIVTCVALAGCAADGTPRGAGGSSTQVVGLFRTPSKVGGLAPSPTAGWYVSQQTPRYVKMGLAREAGAARRGWFARLAGAPTATPSVVIAETAALPLPSIVQITNVATGASLRLRIDERAPMGEDLLRLDAATARELGVSPGAPLLVRVRFVEPAIAYQQGVPLTYALRRRSEAAPQLAAVDKTVEVPVAAAPVIRADTPIATARSEQPLAKPRILAAAPPTASAPPLVRAAAPTERPRLLRVQAGAFANPGNARRAVAMLSAAGSAQIQPVHRADGVTLYRVFLECREGAQQAEAVRAKAVQAGFADAQVVRPS
jgi:rare lipoprotein A